MNPDPFDLWVIHQVYFGLFESDRIICSSDDFVDITFIVDALVKYHKNRPFAYYVSYRGNVYKSADAALEKYRFLIPFPDVYLKPIYCLGGE